MIQEILEKSKVVNIRVVGDDEAAKSKMDVSEEVGQCGEEGRGA